MSKYDNLFKNTYNSEKSLKPNIFLSKDANENNPKDTKFNYKEELFPDLISVNKVVASVTNATNTNSKNYANIAATVNEVKIVEKNPVLPGWVQYTKSTTKNTILFDVTYGDKTKRQIEQEQEDAMLNDPLYIYNKTMTTLANNWNKYKRQYDEVHGEGAYELIHYTKPIYPSLDEHFSDDEKDSNSYSSEEEPSYYSYDKH